MNPDRHRARTQYDSSAAALVGRCVQEVRYWDQGIFADDPQEWDYDDWHHAVMGVDLLTDRGPLCVLWTDTFYPYGVEVFHTPFSQQESGSGPYDATGSDRWRDRLNSPVEHVQTFWDGPRYVRDRVSGAYMVYVPVALRIDFAAGPVWMVAGMPKVLRNGRRLRARRRDHGRVHTRANAADRVPRFRVPDCQTKLIAATGSHRKRQNRHGERNQSQSANP